MIKRRKKLREPDGRRYYALVDDITDADPTSSYSRSYLLLDAIFADGFDRVGAQSVSDPSGLALIRAMSTPNKWDQVTAFQGPLAKGDWIALTLDDRGGAPLAWEMLATQNYVQGPPRSVRSIRRLGDGVIAATADEKLAVSLSFASTSVRPPRPQITAQAVVSELSKSIRQGSLIEVVAIDVGQAAANLIRVDHVPVALFDAGAPIWFNKNSLPRAFSPPILGKCPIILSHWDFDHFDLGRRYPNYRSRQWYAPDQPVGPNTLLFQRSLGSNLSFVNGNGSSGPFALAPGNATNAKDRNGTGYQLQIKAAGETALLTGDAAYGVIIPQMLSGVTSLTIPHHGGRDLSMPPRAAGLSRAVASYGIPNGYRHPDAGTILAHSRNGWKVDQTAQTSNKSRGNRRILP